MSMLATHLLFVPALACACACPPRGPSPPPPIPQDAVAGMTPCDSSCYRYRQLGCPEGRPTPAGHACEDVCLNAADHGVDLGGAVQCTSVAGTCQEVRGCSR